MNDPFVHLSTAKTKKDCDFSSMQHLYIYYEMSKNLYEKKQTFDIHIRKITSYFKLFY